MSSVIMYVVIAMCIGILGAAIFMLIRKYKPQKLSPEYFQEKWKELQKLLKNKAQWAEAITDADKLLDEALKKRRMRGRSMGERLVKAQRQFTDNDGVWFGHKLRNKIDSQPDTKLKQKEVKQALMGIRQGLKDLGAL